MTRNIVALLFLAALYVMPFKAHASCTAPVITSGPTAAVYSDLIYSGSCTVANEVLFETGVAAIKYDACFLMSTVGAVKVLVSLDGTYSTDPHQLDPRSGTSADPVVATVAGHVYSLPTKFAGIRVIANGAAATAVLRCFKS
ncbi:MAG: hypothetical protein ABI640_12905 [Gammaproteobacteria bacterium]